MPPLTLTNFAPAEETLALDERRPSATELRVEMLLVAGLVVAVGALYLLEPRSADLAMVVVCTALVALANGARFDLRLTWTALLDHVGGAMREVGAIVRSSHERWDGRGYPDGLAGGQIPHEARIVCACDAYNAMTTTRSYRTAMEPAAAAAELVRCSGTQFDPAVVEALLAVLGVEPTGSREGLLAA